MHCDCCDKLLEDAEATARFVETGNYVGMCSVCRSFLPKDIKWRTRHDLERMEAEQEDSEIQFDEPYFDDPVVTDNDEED